MLKDLIPEPARGSDMAIGGPEGGCGGCGGLIRDRFYLLVVDRAWHANCLRCCRCSQRLDSELSCFSREGNIYCKEDYYRLFSTKRCSRCHAGIACGELVMRARDLVYHVGCFVCALCGSPLCKGDMAGLRGDLVYCSAHYDTVISDGVIGPPYYAGVAQKGRPRKRKPPTGSNEPSDLSMSNMRMDLLHPELGSPLDLGSYDSAQSPGGVSLGGGSSRTKRMRTSFKHHQLRTMKSYFAINQNPDAKDLKQLAQKTGLSKRVLQVWFQNARAKWRRNIMRQEGGTGGAPGTPLGAGSSGTGPPSAVMMGDSNSMPASHHSLDDMHSHITFADLY